MNYPEPLRVPLSSQYTGIIDFKNRIVSVGRSKFQFEPILILAEMIKEGEKRFYAQKRVSSNG